MAAFFTNLGFNFVLGLGTPLTAVCVLPLYPGFIAFLAGDAATPAADGRPPVRPVALGLAVVAGTLSFMTALGVLFTTLLRVSLTHVVGVVSPIAFGVLLLASLVLILDLDLSRLFPKVQAPAARNRILRAYLFGFFFGAIVLPCNPGFIAFFFARIATDTGLMYVGQLLQFTAFGLGIGAPLLVLALGVSGAGIASGGRGRARAGGRAEPRWSAVDATRWLARHKTLISRVAGSLMLLVSLFFLACDFHVFGIDLGLCDLFIG